MKKIGIGSIIALSLLGTISGCTKNKEVSELSESKNVKGSSSLDLTSESLKSSGSTVSSQISVAKTEEQSITMSSDDTSTTSSEEAIDTKNLTTEQVKQWVFENLQVGNKDKFTQNDYIFDMVKGDDGELYIGVLEDHSTPAMRAAGADEDTIPRVGTFKIDSEGHLLRSEDAGTTYYKISDSFKTPK